MTQDRLPQEYLDSIAFECDAILIGEVVDFEAGNIEAAEKPRVAFRVREDILGSNPGGGNPLWLQVSFDDFMYDLDSYPGGRTHVARSLSKFREGDFHYLFLKTTLNRDDYGALPPFLTVPVDDENVHGITPGQGKPGLDYDAVMPADAFRAALREAVQQAAELTNFLHGLERSRDPGADLRARLRARSSLYDPKTRLPYSDSIGEALCLTAARTRDPTLLDELLPWCLSSDRSILWKGFGSPSGRNYLLGRIPEPELDDLRRREYIRILDTVSPHYHELTPIDSREYPPEHAPGEGNGRWLESMARGAVQLSEHDAAAGELIRILEKAIDTPESPSTQADSDEAANILLGAEATFGPLGRFELEQLRHAYGERSMDAPSMITLIHGGRNRGEFPRYRSIRGRAGALVAFEVQARNFKPSPKPPPPEIYENVPESEEGMLSRDEIAALLWAISSDNAPGPSNCRHILTSKETGAQFEAIQEKILHLMDHAEARQRSSFRLPTDAPPGEYKHTLLLFGEDGTIVNESFAYPLFIKAG